MTAADPVATCSNVAATPLLIVVPVRGGSKRLPDKHVRPMLGQTLLQRTAGQIRDAGLDAPVLLTTDSEDIAAAGRELGWHAPFLRPSDLASDTATTVDAVLHALEWVRQDRGAYPELTLLVQVTSPLRRPERLATAIETLRRSPDYDAVVGVSEAAPSAEYLMVAHGVDLSPLNAEAPGPVLRLNGAVYAIRTDALRRHRTFVPPRTHGLIMPEIESVDVDDMDDWHLAEILLARRAE